ncbi:MAG: hypothetical protein KKA84_15950 [Bacteroidetes bacterium]|nr:hypothetical protein [Bacteroidota bacterium]
MNAVYSNLFRSFVYAAFIVLLSFCSADLSVQQETQLTGESLQAVQYSMVFIIHGDGDYVYHDTIGNEYNADEVTVEKAQAIAKQNPYAEVFIFHQKPKRHFLFFFPLKDGEFYYYRNGQLIVNESYWRDQEQSNLENELEYYRHFRADNKNEMVNMFLYFGHEIPELGGVGYDVSYPERAFTIHNLANGMKDLTGVSSRFDIMILSTCYGGTPYTIGTLGAFSKYIIASPENLHLSYFDLTLLERLDLSSNYGDVQTFTKRFAQQAFERLSGEIQTAVSVVVYDVDQVKDYYQSVYTDYDNTLRTIRGDSRFYPATVEQCDCWDIPNFTRPSIKLGVDVFYRPARFGKAKNKNYHSGWECWKNIE